MKQTKHQRSDFSVGLKAEPALIRTDVIERLVDNGESDDRVDQIAIDANIEVDPNSMVVE